MGYVKCDSSVSALFLVRRVCLYILCIFVSWFGFSSFIFHCLFMSALVDFDFLFFSLWALFCLLHLSLIGPALVRFYVFRLPVRCVFCLPYFCFAVCGVNFWDLICFFVLGVLVVQYGEFI